MKRRATEIIRGVVNHRARLIGCSTSRPSFQAIRPAHARSAAPRASPHRQEHRTAEVVAVQLWVVWGPHEAPSERGFSHFAGTCFSRVPELGPGFVTESGARGGRTNAATSLDYTYYSCCCPHPCRAAVEVMADMAFNSTFDPSELGRERESCSKSARGEDNPRSFLVRRLYDSLCRASYGFPVSATLWHSGRHRRTLACLLHKRHYVASNMTLVVVVPWTPRWSGPPPCGHSRRDGERSSARCSHRSRRLGRIGGQSIERSERQAYLGLGGAPPRLGDRTCTRFDLLSHILGGSLTSD